MDNIGEWRIQTEEFRRWCCFGGEGEGNKAVCFATEIRGSARHLLSNKAIL